MKFEPPFSGTLASPLLLLYQLFVLPMASYTQLPNAAIDAEQK